MGDPDSRTPGLVPQVELAAVDSFHRAGQDQRTDAFALIRAQDYLEQQEARIVNLSLAGPANAALEAQVAGMAQAGMVLIAAAGNMGPSAPPIYPAAYPQVIAVTAVDRDRGVCRRADRSPYIDFAAPGVDVWTAASVRGAHEDRHVLGRALCQRRRRAAAAGRAFSDAGRGPGASGRAGPQPGRRGTRRHLRLGPARAAGGCP
ncbi:S8 family serine peptidase [Paracoccus sp. MC1862]|nr:MULTISPECIES: S8 family serine peptidase [unclassified Paracoccus (in: a-proteobacteria)]MBB1491316.1 S8 family serine peptidase [Paracoccus sp. MC1854]MBB1498094.1 S8 family serine peptidase [Paracoccus sp. MC1862]QQO43470.1 S8 family serine peptidase [Paracoccus sp. MC1862]